MEITNKYGYPEALVTAVRNDTYSKGESDYSVTQLLKPARMVALEALHGADKVEDVSDRIWSLYGQIAHLILERANEADLVEKRFMTMFHTRFGNKSVSGQVDSLAIKRGILTDWKFTTVWSFLDNKPPKPEFVAQLNMQRFILAGAGLKADRLQIVGLLRDWQKSKAQDEGYPKHGVVTQEIPVWDDAFTEAFIIERITAMEEAKAGNLPLCSGPERWAKQDIWAVMKGGRAIRMGLCFSKEAALEMQKKNAGTRIEFRPGLSPRCESYCSVSEYCEQFKKSKGPNALQERSPAGW